MNELPDPYQAPVSSLSDQSEPYPINRAGAGRRFLGFLIDYVASIFFVILFLFAWNMVVAMTSGEEGLELGDEPESPLRDRLIGLIFYLCYYVVFEGLFSRTIGKFVTGTIVVDDSGFPPSFLQILGRSLARMIPFDPLSFLGAGTRGWHDTLSGTNVVRNWKPEPTSGPTTMASKLDDMFLKADPR